MNRGHGSFLADPLQLVNRKNPIAAVVVFLKKIENETGSPALGIRVSNTTENLIYIPTCRGLSDMYNKLS